MRGLVNRCASEAEISCVRQRAHQVVAEVAAGRPVRLVHEHENVFAGVDVRGDVVKLVDHGDDEPARVSF